MVALAIINDDTKAKVRDMFSKELKGGIEALFFHSPGEGEQAQQFTDAAREVLTDLADLSDGKMILRDLGLSDNAEIAGRYGIDKTPSLILLDSEGKDRGLRFFGAPLGYEFIALLEDIVDLSKNETRLSQQARTAIQAIDKRVKIQVFTTPT